MDSVLQFLTAEALAIVALDNLPPGTPAAVICIPTPSIQVIHNTVDSSDIVVHDSDRECLYQQEIEGTTSYRVQLNENSLHKTTVVPHLLASVKNLAPTVKEFLTNKVLLDACMPVVWGNNYVSSIAKCGADATIVRAAMLICCNGCEQLRIRAQEIKEWVMPSWTEEELETTTTQKPKQKKQDKKNKDKREARAVRGWARIWRKWRHTFANKMQEANRHENLASRFLAQRFVFAEMSIPYKRCA